MPAVYERESVFVRRCLEKRAETWAKERALKRWLEDTAGVVMTGAMLGYFLAAAIM